MARLTKDGYGQIELNQVAFRRDGRIEAQCALDADAFTTAAPAENAMLLCVDRANRKVKRPTEANVALYPVALHYSTEHIYDERTPGLKNFCLVPGTFYPRMGFLSIGDEWTTNTVDLGSYATLAAVQTAMASAPVFATVGVDGYAKISGTTMPDDAPAGIILQVAECTTMPDGQEAIEFICVAC